MSERARRCINSFLIDTNILVYAENERSPHHRVAAAALRRAVESASPWCLAWQNVMEFLAVTTNPRAVHGRVRTMEEALGNIRSLLAAPNLTILVEGDRYWEIFQESVRLARGTHGVHVHDCRLAALMKEHGVERIITADEGFSRFPFLKVENPIKDTA